MAPHVGLLTTVYGIWFFGIMVPNIDSKNHAKKTVNICVCVYIMYIPLYIYMYTPPKMLGFIEYIHTKCSRDHYHYVTVLKKIQYFPLGGAFTDH